MAHILYDSLKVEKWDNFGLDAQNQNPILAMTLEHLEQNACLEHLSPNSIFSDLDFWHL